jgi:hypothetical protein
MLSPLLYLRRRKQREGETQNNRSVEANDAGPPVDIAWKMDAFWAVQMRAHPFRLCDKQPFERARSRATKVSLAEKTRRTTRKQRNTRAATNARGSPT